MNELGTKTGEFCVRDRSSLLETVKLLYLVSGTEANNPSKLISSLLSLLSVSLSHPMALSDQVREHSKEWEYDQHYVPARLASARNIMTPE